jgi:hypothetical protein
MEYLVGGEWTVVKPGYGMEVEDRALDLLVADVIEGPGNIMQ